MKTYKTVRAARVADCCSAFELMSLLEHSACVLGGLAAAADKRESENCPRAKYLRRQAKRFQNAAAALL